jgi:large subunit ribosomal protein L7/L12
MKVVKVRLGLGLKEAKELVDSYPCCIKQMVPIEEAFVLKDQIEEAGGKVEFK